MNTLIFIKGDVIEKDIKKNLWIMHFLNMSGDADHYEEETIETKNTATMFDNLEIYATRWLMNEKDKYTDSKIMEAVRDKAIELGMDPDDAEDLYRDMVGSDVTCEDCLASPDKYWVTYFDENGIEYSVNIDNKNKVFANVDEYNVREVFNEN
jgi:hypothetical protein